MDQDITKIIELIDKKIKALTVTRQTLIDEFGNGRLESFPQLPLMQHRHRETNKKQSRKDTVEKLIREQGPMSRKEIVEKSGVPKGTVAYVLNDRNRFVSKGNKWHIKEEATT